MSLLQDFINLEVLVVTVDGRVLVGTMRGVDQTTNIILEHCKERVFSTEGTEVVPIGLFLLRGDNVVIIGEMDTDKEADVDITSIKTDPLGDVTL